MVMNLLAATLLGTTARAHAQWRVEDESMSHIYIEAVPYPYDEPSSVGDRMPAYLLGTLAGYGAAALSGLTVGGLAIAADDCAPGEWCGLGGAVAGVLTAGISAPFLLAGGIHLGGDLGGGSGNYGATLLGALLGTGAGLGVAAGFATLDDEGAGPVLAVTSAALLPVMGAIMGYELSNDPYHSEKPPHDGSTFSLKPTASVDLKNKAFTLGLSGSL